MITSKRQLFILITLVLGSSVILLDSNTVTLALPAIERELGGGLAAMQWVLDAYLVSLSALILFAGSLGDIYGHKKVYLTGLIGFAFTSILCAIAPTLPLLIGARVLQGVFGALLMPGALAMINTNLPPGRRSTAIGKWAAWSSLAIIAAPFLAGFVLDLFSWRMIFLIHLPLIVMCFMATLLFVKENKNPVKRKVDFGGALLMAVGFALLTYGLIEGPVTQWSILTIASLCLGVMILLLFIFYEKRRKDPMVSLTLFQSRNFSGANLYTFLVYGALGGSLFMLSIYLQNSLQFTAFQAGLAMLPVSLFLLFFVGKVGALVPRYGARLFMILGPIVAACGVWWLAFLQPGIGYVIGVLPGTLLYGAGFSLLVSPLITTTMTSVGDRQSGVASGMNNAISRASGLMVIALLGVFDSSDGYFSAMLFCAIMTVLASAVAYLFIKGPSLRTSK